MLDHKKIPDSWGKPTKEQLIGHVMEIIDLDIEGNLNLINSPKIV